MDVIPAIDLLEGRVVRLRRGDFEQVTWYSAAADEYAKRFESAGARLLHVVDLEGARDGHPKNLEQLMNIRRAVGIPIEFGGGLRDDEDIQHVLQIGAERVVLGTRALEITWLERLLARFSKQIVVSLDVVDNEVQVRGWREASGASVYDVAKALDRLKVERLIYTNIRRDGMLMGPDLDGLRALLGAVTARVTLSGGIEGERDIAALCKIRDAHFEGVIVGRALYDGTLDLARALARARGS